MPGYITSILQIRANFTFLYADVDCYFPLQLLDQNLIPWDLEYEHQILIGFLKLFPIRMDSI